MYVCIILVLILYILYTHFKPAPKTVPVVSAPAQPDFSAKYKEDLEHCREELRRTFTELGHIQQQLRVQTNQNQIMEREKTAAKEAYDRLFHQKKSSEVKTGQISEQLICLIPEFPVPIHTLKFFGSPLDYISIDMEAEMISFIEIKSGGATLSDKQRKIRKMIKDKRVQFFEVRVDDKGVKVK